MGMCKGCNQVFSSLEMKEGWCKECISTRNITFYSKEEQEAIDKDISLKKHIHTVTITTETVFISNADKAIVKRFGIVTSQRVYGLNFIKDFFLAIRDVIGGRVSDVEEPLANGKKEVIEDLQKQAYLLGANAVIGVTIEHQINNVLSISATGTAVIIENN